MKPPKGQNITDSPPKQLQVETERNGSSQLQRSGMRVQELKKEEKKNDSMNEGETEYNPDTIREPYINDGEQEKDASIDVSNGLCMYQSTLRTATVVREHV